ncbi:hypothetical protein [Actinospica robiniae]|uniref:hypothetical protein n=1 Tax=Actinospica robiniae TaxID=304901 RepID=UPI0004233440|nr:hypothetical protein [Actinospica robiniae]
MNIHTNGDAVLQAGSSAATPFNIRASCVGHMCFSDAAGRYWTLQSGGAVELVADSSLTFATQVTPPEFEAVCRDLGIDVTSLPAYEALSPCQQAEVDFTLDFCSGLFAALGLSPYIVPTASIGVALWQYLQTNPAVYNAFINLAKDIGNNPGNVVTDAGKILSLLNENQMAIACLKMMLNAAGWFVAAAVVAKLVELLLLTDAAVAQSVATFVVWCAQLVDDGVDVVTAC